MKRAHFKFILAAIASLLSFAIAAFVAFEMFFFDSVLYDHAKRAGHAKQAEAFRAYHHETSTYLPAILFLCVFGIVLGILAIRFYNHAKSEFAD